MKIEKLWVIQSFLKICIFAFALVLALALAKTQTNRAPHFLAGGDMAHFSLPEDIAVGSTVYKLRGADPDGGEVHYSISGAYFSVNKYSGDVILIKELDRESIDTIEVIISITDEPVNELESNTVSLRREIPVIDVNDNRPTFNSSQYDFTVSEATKIGTVVYSGISISDIDFGLNSMINIACVQSTACQIFQISIDKLSDGHYNGMITLNQALNYEQQSSYTLWLRAIDSNPKKPLSSTTKVIIDIEDVQDQPPIFLYTPYSVSVSENTKSGEKLLTVEAKDGDIKNQRPIVFSLEQDILNYFAIENNANGNASIFTSENPIDREHPTIIQMGGIYSFYVKATELVDADELPGDETKELITVVIEDRNDQLPKFNKPLFRLNVSENISAGSPLPNLGMTVYDNDIGENAKFSLSLRATDMRFTDCFSIEPSVVVGKSAVIIRIVDNSLLDYESGIRNIELYISAFTTDENNIVTEAASSRVNLTILDANDNAPEFAKSSYVIDIAENVPPRTRVANISAIDRDSGIFSQITYTIGGFGMDKFETDLHLGGLILENKIDYEQQSSYSLTINAKDGGNRTASANVLVNVIDVNDNAPIFEFSEYRRNIREGSQHFQPKFIVKATDMDGVDNSKISYSIVDSNSNAIEVDEMSGEILMVQPASSQHTSRGQYELKIRATDSGEPSLFTDTMVFIRVGIPGNQRPVFKGTPYNVTIPETSISNTFITTVRASDPDGPTDLLEYKITAGADNFYIDSKSGMIYLSENADLGVNGIAYKKYNVTVLVIDAGMPFRETAQATVTVNVVDVNDKPPVFKEHNYVAYISEETPVGTNIMNVTAYDPDTDALLEYSLAKPFYITDRRGFTSKSDIGNYSDTFSINEDTGEIKLAQSLKGHLIHRITVFVEVRDKHAVENIKDQIHRVEATFFVEAVEEKRPIFLIGGWTKSNPVIEYDMFEEQSIGSTVAKIIAQDPVTMIPINKFQAKSPLPRQLAMDPVGNIVITERIDYETISAKILSFQIEAISEEGEISKAKVVINVIDINDHAPQFQFKNYQGSVEENAKKGTVVLSVTATDGDLPSSPQGYGNISYHLSGEHAFLFEIDSKKGKIKVGEKALIDREKQSVLNLIAIATDTPAGGKERRKNEVSIRIDVLDVNDNAPEFMEKEYSMVILENCPIGVSVLNVSAMDPDGGSAGQVIYEIVNEFDAMGLFGIDSKTGEITVQRSLTGRGRNYPYSLTIRAQDNGEPALFTDVHVSIFVGDVVTNDGIPLFIHPTENEVAFISEDSPIGSMVFRVIAVDADDPFTPEGQIQFSILRDGSDADAFHIDSKTGVITSKIKLDREFKEMYSLMIMVKDEGVIPQQATRVLRIHVKDVDDNVPLFKRSVDENPLQILIKEELSHGTVIGAVEAVDLDAGENAKIGYVIIDGNEENYFNIIDSANNTGLIQVLRRIDREEISQFLLTVKCFKKQNKKNTLNKKSYNKMDLSERQIHIKILDIDDNYPEFLEKNITIGVHYNIALDSLLLKLVAYDRDIEAGSIAYNISYAVYLSQKSGLEFHNITLPFILNKNTGELRTNSSLTKYVDGYFLLEISANSGSPTIYSFNYVKIYIIREKGLISFVFSKTPAEVKDYLINFKTELENVLALPSSQLNIYETQFHSKEDGSLDFTKTSSCFQIIADNFGTKEAELFFKNENNDKLKEIYRKYDVHSVQRCANSQAKPRITWVQISLLGIAGFIGVISLISSCILCCSYSRWQRLK